MKHKSFLSFFILLFGLGISTTSCEDMLTPDMDRYSEGFSGRDTVNFYLGIVRNVQDMVEQNGLLGDLRSDLVATTSYSSDSISDIINYKRQPDGDNGLLNRAAYYKVINQCNFYLAKVDTNAVKNNIYFMRREYAQVVAIRAWTYLQLVQTYGEVPFITKPVTNADTGWEKNPEAWANASTLVDLLKGDLEKAQVFEHTLGAPDYGNYSTGNSNFSVPSRYVRFYNDLILADLYLLRGESREDYVAAAKNYYYFLSEQRDKNEGVYLATRARYGRYTTNVPGKYNYYPSIADWISRGLDAAPTSFRELVTIIPSAANSSFGRVLTNTAQIYGFDPHSTNTTVEGDDSEEATTTGSIYVTPNYRNRQVEPSEAYLQLCAAQTYCEPEYGGTTGSDLLDVTYYDGQGDARLHGTAPMLQTSDGNKGRFIMKASPTSTVNMSGYAYSGSFKFYKALYRIKQVYLRYAEAINRAGYPRTAFAVLRNGLDFEKMPTVMDSLRYDDVAQEAHRVYYLDSIKGAVSNNYIGIDELRRAQLDPEYSLFIDFKSSSRWLNDGIHEQGCGQSSELDSLYSYSLTVSQRIEDEAKRTNTMSSEVQAVIDRLRAEGKPAASVSTLAEGEGEGEGEGETPTEPDRSDYPIIEPEAPAEANALEINAVETLIADECALETAYEGTRMFDLIRFARHKDNDQSGLFAAQYGTNWIAWKIARRNEKLAPYEQPAMYDNTLYNMLLNSQNWYIAVPEY